MYKIGEVSKICGVSQKTLRFYEKKELLKPAEIDSYTGYRFYNDDNIKTIQKIINLKKIGMSLNQIREIELNNQNLYSFLDQKFENMQLFMRSSYSLINNKGDIKMNNFINDEDALGKWEYIGSVKNKSEKIDTKPYFLSEIYFLENGQGYWLINSWSKGELYVMANEYPIPEVYPYEINNNKLYVSVMNDKTKKVDRIAIYKKINNKSYTQNDLARKDQTNLPFISDSQIIGTWKGIAISNNLDTFNPKNNNFPSFIYDITFEKDGNVKIRYTDGRISNLKWTKDFLIDNTNSLCSKYEIKVIDNKKFLFIENKNGDYIYNGHISSYLIFKK